MTNKYTPRLKRNTGTMWKIKLVINIRSSMQLISMLRDMEMDLGCKDRKYSMITNSSILTIHGISLTFKNKKILFFNSQHAKICQELMYPGYMLE